MKARISKATGFWWDPKKRKLIILTTLGEVRVDKRDLHRLATVCQLGDKTFEMLPADWRNFLTTKKIDDGTVQPPRRR